MRGGRHPRREVGRAAQGLRHAQAGDEGDRGGGHRVLPPAHRPLQVPGRRRVRRPAQDVDGQGPEVRPARQGMERPREADQLMAIEQQLTDTLTQAIRAKDTRTADVVRMLKTRLQERRTAKGFTGQVDDALVLDVIGAYRKQLQKALAEYEKLGERGAAQAAQLHFEIEFCERFLPKGLDAAALRTLVKERAQALGLTDAKQIGRLVGDVMKTHKGQVDAADVKKIAEELLRACQRLLRWCRF